MKPQKISSKIIIDFLISPGVTIGLFALLILVLIPTTFSTVLAATLRIPIQVVLALIGLNITVCTLAKIKALRFSTLTIHLGTLIILFGGFINTLGFVATVNIFEGGSTGEVFRWDTGKNTGLGFNLKIVRINYDYYPVAVKVGVLKNGQKSDLILTKTGDTFIYEKFRILVVSLNPLEEYLEIEVQSATGNSVGTLSTAGRRDLPKDFPLDFKLVAFQNPELKRVWVNLELEKNGELIASGTSEVNHPFHWQGMQFFLTKTAKDTYDRSFAGIQISKAPGIPYVYGGFAIFCLGLLLLLCRWFKLVHTNEKPQS